MIYSHLGIPVGGKVPGKGRGFCKIKLTTQGLKGYSFIGRTHLKLNYSL
jgi:hypothetical protein